jgi:Domain of unknown function (DUF4835)
MYKRIFFILFNLLLLLASPDLPAQDINARVSINSAQVSSATNPNVFRTLQTALSNFLNKRKWTDKIYTAKERINCSFLLNLQSSPEPGVFVGSLTVQSARPVYNSNYQAALLNFMDNEVQFRYQEFQPLEFNENRVQGAEPLAGNLTALFAFYVNIIVGMDNDSFAPRGGDLYFQKASAIVNSAPDGRIITGWRAFDSQRNRYWLSENLMNNKYTLVHDATYTYYRLGLDKLYENDTEARDQLMNAFSSLYTLATENPNIMIFSVFFQGKADEIIKIFKKANPGERARVIEMLQKLDISNASRYKQELK